MVGIGVCVTANNLGVTRADPPGLSWSQPVWQERSAGMTSKALKATVLPPVKLGWYNLLNRVAFNLRHTT